MAVSAFENTSNTRRTLGVGGNLISIDPGETKSFETDNLVSNDIDEITEGYFTVTPTLDQAIIDAVGSESVKLLAIVAKINEVLDAVDAAADFAAMKTAIGSITDL